MFAGIILGTQAQAQGRSGELWALMPKISAFGQIFAS